MLLPQQGHGCSGAFGSCFATFVADSFTGRGITNTITDQSQLSSYAMMNDTFAALAVLAKHPRIDPNKIAVMGFSKGAVPSLYASMNRFQSAYAPEGASFASYIGFYTPCNIALIDDEKVSAKPIRLYHGIADDWVPVGPCRDYVARLKKAGARLCQTSLNIPVLIMLSTTRRSRARCSSRRR
jgi:dienelactone hydrolase